ncbi:MAG: outer membrane protein transport protein [Chitinophagales bacterium]|nr:outer membrane protein transport protein [Chitinophagales bacterium]
MSNSKIFLAVLSFLGSWTIVTAQTDIDALRYSTPLSLGTARSAAIGNATAGLGGDISTLNSNPAGLGQMGLSEVSFSGGFNVNKSANNYLGSSTDVQKAAFQLNNFGMVYVPKRNFKGIKNITLAASYNRQENFNQSISAKGINDHSSYSDIYAEQLNGDGADSSRAMNNYPFGASLAFESGVIGRTDDNFFFSILELPLTQRFEIKRSGSLSDFSFGTGVAINDQFMVGMNIGIPFINYEEEFYVRETDETNISGEINYWDKRDKYRTEGNGINAKIGVLFIPTPDLRIGASFTTPTRYSLKDLYATYFRADFETYTLDNFNKPAEGYFDYKYISPLKLNTGLSYVNSNLGFATVEYEYTNPAKNKYVFTDDMYNSKDAEERLNESIKNKYKSVHTVKVGLEGIIAEQYRARVGFQYRSSAYSDQDAVNHLAKNNQMAISGGLGYRGKSFYTDVAYVHQLSDAFIVPYNVSLAPSDVLTSKFNRSNFIVSVGIKF